MKMNKVRHKHKILSMKREVQKLLLNEFWFIVLVILFICFFVVDSFDFGVGIASRFVGNNDEELSLYMNTVGPYWDANEVWVITAGGAMFAAFPHWYATMFRGFYIAWVLMLLALI